MKTWHEPLSYLCNQCDTTMDTYEKLKVHLIESNHVGMSFGCINCNFKAITKGMLAKQKQKTHTVYGMAAKHKKSPEDFLKESILKSPYNGQRTKNYKPPKMSFISEFQEINKKK